MNQEIPDGWNKVKFKELAKQKSVRIDNPGESGFEKYVGLEHLDSGELVVKRYGNTSDVTSTMKLFNKGDILFARRNTYLRRISVAPFDGVCSGDIIVLEPILNHIVEGFLPIFMQFEPFENKVIALSAGAFSKRIKWKQLAEEEIVIPSIEEQKKISEILWSIEENTEKNESLINATEVLKRGFLNELLTKGIGHKKFKTSEIGDIPQSWDIITTEQMLIKQKGAIKIGPFGSQLRKNYLVNEGYKVYGQENVFENDFKIGTRFVDEERFHQLKSCEIKPDDFLITMMGTIGKCTIVPKEIESGIMDSHLLRLRIDESKYYKEFLLHLLKSDLIQIQLINLSVGGIMAGLSSKVIKQLIFPKPSIAEQKKLSYILNNFDSNLVSYYENLESLKALKYKLTKEFLSGKLIISKEVL